MTFTNDEIIKLKLANNKLGINNDIHCLRDKQLIIVYSPPKVGSTSLISSLRVSLNNKYTILHLHNEDMLRVIYGITDVKIMEIIKYNEEIGKKVYVFDIYRTEIEQKLSLFFENIDTFHFNASIEVLNKYKIDVLINRFNNLFTQMKMADYFREIYNINYPSVFDHEKKYLLVEKDNIKYIKLRLKDSNIWSKIIGNILNENILLITDYQTNNKICSELYSKFKKIYKIPINILQLVEASETLKYYYSIDEYNDYINNWKNNTSASCETYSKEEYALYMKISSENQNKSEIQYEHYFDEGCICKICQQNRDYILKLSREGKKVPFTKICSHHKIKGKKGLNKNIFFQMSVNKKKPNFTPNNWR